MLWHHWPKIEDGISYLGYQTRYLNGGQLYWAFHFSKGSLAYSTTRIWKRSTLLLLSLWVGFWAYSIFLKLFSNPCYQQWRDRLFNLCFLKFSIYFIYANQICLLFGCVACQYCKILLSPPGWRQSHQASLEMTESDIHSRLLYCAINYCLKEIYTTGLKLPKDKHSSLLFKFVAFWPFLSLPGLTGFEHFTREY